MTYGDSDVKYTLLSANQPSERQQPEVVPQLSLYVEKFVRERQYLKGVTASTVELYRYSFQAFKPVMDQGYATVLEFKAGVIQRIEELQRSGRGNRAVSINTYLRNLKALLNWLHQEKILGEPIRLSWLKEEQKVLPTLSDEAVRQLISWRPRTYTQRRLHALVVCLLDTGLRISEELGLRREDLDLDSIVLHVHGKGNKHRIVPMSIECRKVLWKWLQSSNAQQSGVWVFPTRHGSRLEKRDVLRDLKLLARNLGITATRMSPHTLRHTMATAYIRNGGDPFRLQRILGHATLTMTMRYVKIQTADLSSVHDRLSVVGKGIG